MQHVDVAGLGGGERVVERGGGVAALAGLDEVHAGALGPDFELLDGGGAEGVGGAEQDGLAFAAVHGGELAAGGGLAGAVHADHHDDLGRRGGVRDGRVDRGEDAEQLGLEQDFELRAAGDALAQRALAQAGEDGVGRRAADVGGEQRQLQVVERAVVDLAGERGDRAERLVQRVTRAGDRLLHAVEE